MAHPQLKNKRKTARSAPAHAAAAHVSAPAVADTGRRRPRQRRSVATVEAITEAAEIVIAERGYARATTNLIAERAGVSIGSLYQYFPNKEAILRALVEKHTAQVVPVVDRALRTMARSDISIKDALSALFAHIVELHGDRPELNRVLGDRGPLPPVIERMHRDGEEAIAHQIAAVLEGRRDVRRGDALMMAYVLAQATEALSRWLVHNAPDSLDKDLYVQESVRMLVGYVIEPEAAESNKRALSASTLQAPSSARGR